MEQLSAPKYAVNEYTTPHNTVYDDIEQIARTGGTGIGLWEAKLERGDDQNVRAAIVQAGLAATYCVPAVHTVLPVPFNTPGVPSDPIARTKLICESVKRLAAFEPVAIVVGPGTSGDAANPVGPVEAVEEGLAVIADVAGAQGVPVAFELLARRRGSPLYSLPDIVRFVDRVGRENVGIMFDVFHSWCEPDLHAHLREHGSRVIGVHVNDVKVHERGGFDRELPGQGRGVAPEIMATLIESGYDGWWELEVFSDDGTFGMELPDSYWKLPHEELLTRSKEAFDASYAKALAIVQARRGGIDGRASDRAQEERSHAAG
jgi:sugar phosphate isomerase/epimerase